MRSVNCFRVYCGGLFMFLLMSSIGLTGCASRLVAQETEPPKPYLGFVVEQPTESSGVVVIDLDPKGPVGLAGIKAKDVVESIDGIAITSMADMSTAIKGKEVGAKLKFIVKREGKSVSAEVTLAAAPSGAPAGGVPVEKVPPPKDGDEPAPLPDPDSGAPRASLGSGPSKPYLGLTVVPHARGGAAISSIRKDSPAAKIGFPLGGVIIRVNDTPVENPDDLINFIAAMSPGSTIELSYMHNERLYRKQVKLSSIGGGGTDRTEPEVVSPPAAPAPGDIPALRDPPAKEDRPILNGIGRALGGAPLGGIGGGSAAMERQLDELRGLVQSLEERIAKLESELAALKSGKPEETPAPPPAPSP